MNFAKEITSRRDVNRTMKELFTNKTNIALTQISGSNGQSAASALHGRAPPQPPRQVCCSRYVDATFSRTFLAFN